MLRLLDIRHKSDTPSRAPNVVHGCSWAIKDCSDKVNDENRHVRAWPTWTGFMCLVKRFVNRSAGLRCRRLHVKYHFYTLFSRFRGRVSLSAWNETVWWSRGRGALAAVTFFDVVSSGLATIALLIRVRCFWNDQLVEELLYDHCICIFV